MKNSATIEQDNCGQTVDDGAIKALLMKALKEQEKDYSQVKMPAPPVDETTSGTQANNLLKHSPPFS